MSKYDELITDCHDNPMYAADIILSLEKQVTALEAENTRLQDELNIITTAFPGLRQRPPGMPGDTLLDYITKAEQAKKYVTALEAEIKLLENEQ